MIELNNSKDNTTVQYCSECSRISDKERNTIHDVNSNCNVCDIRETKPDIKSPERLFVEKWNRMNTIGADRAAQISNRGKRYLYRYFIERNITDIDIVGLCSAYGECTSDEWNEMEDENERRNKFGEEMVRYCNTILYQYAPY